MDNKGSLKLLPWSKKNVVGVAAVYVVNVFVLIGLFVVAVYLNSKGSVTDFADYFSSLSNFFSFIAVLVLLVGVTAP